MAVISDLRNSAAIPAGLMVPSTIREMPPVVPDFGSQEVILNADGPVSNVSIDPATGATVIELDDGGVEIDFSPNAGTRDPGGARAHNANLAEYIDVGELNRIAEDLLLGIQQDDESRKEWLENRAQGIRLLGLKLENPRSGADAASTGVEGQSTVRHPLLLEAVLRFQANARGELLPASGPIKVTDKILQDGTNDELAEGLEEDLNYYLTTVASEYYPDTDRLLLFVGFGGCGFKKVYNCPIRNRPVSESVDAKDLIVSDAATDLRNSRRFTHQIMMKPSTLRRMQIAGAYRDVELITPNPQELNPVNLEIANVQGVNQQQTSQPEDRDHTIYECYCELNIREFEDKENGKETGLALPYRVVIDKDSRQVLEIRRNWNEDDPAKLAKIAFVKYPFVPGFGFYDIGLLQILGNTDNALTAAWRLMLDNGMFSNFPGFIYAKQAGRQNTLDFRIPPGGGVPFDLNGAKIGDQIMPLPYKDVSAAFAAFISDVGQTGQRVGGTAEINVGEGKQDAPVGTTLALIEQATKIMDVVHKRLHAAQAEEFQLLKECFRENPQSFIRSVKGHMAWDEAKFTAALEDASLVPQADPNTPSHMHRLMKAMALKQLQAMSPDLYNKRAVDERVLHMLGFPDAESLFNAPDQGSPGMTPEMMGKAAELALKAKAQQQDAQNDQAELAIKAKDSQVKEQVALMHAHAEAQDMRVKQQMQLQESADQQADRLSRERIAALNLVSDLINHPESQSIAGSAAQKFGVLPNT